jgi:tyrosinase
MVAFSALALGALFAQAWAMPAASDPVVSSAAVPAAASTSLPVAAAQLDHLAELAYNTSSAGISGESENEKRGGCSIWNMRVRRDWRTFSKKQKKSYINSVLCLTKLPARTPANVAAGAKTLQIHYTGTFLAWHRYFTWNFEQALRNECGYTGDFP